MEVNYLIYEICENCQNLAVLSLEGFSVIEENAETALACQKLEKFSCLSLGFKDCPELMNKITTDRFYSPNLNSFHSALRNIDIMPFIFLYGAQLLELSHFNIKTIMVGEYCPNLVTFGCWLDFKFRWR